ncbi:alkyl hydroperoxide reductase protein F [Vibrio variabilis]|uniref:Alkyl hydroperoxide reductase protein F n=1 Tax=Vibrio variabilis TaxID=990271 RepID=A0ABQ0J740_9VIBR|nr:alkyl hydroperoxide reductase protein F [Vibrio variabilis]
MLDQAMKQQLKAYLENVKTQVQLVLSLMTVIRRARSNLLLMTSHHLAAKLTSFATTLQARANQSCAL